MLRRAACPGEGRDARRYVHGASVDDPILWYEGPTLTATSRRHLFADHQGSIVGITNGTGALLAIDRYDDWGVYFGANRTDTYSAGRSQGMSKHTVDVIRQQLLWYDDPDNE